MKRIVTLLLCFLLCAYLVSCFFHVPGALADATAINVVHDIALGYSNGSFVVLPIGVYSGLSLVDNVWYVNGFVYPSGLSTTPTPVPGDLTIDDVAGIAIIGLVLAIALPVAFLAVKRREDD